MMISINDEPWVYSGRMIKKGDRFEAETDNVSGLIALGWAELVTNGANRSQGFEYETRELRARKRKTLQ